MKRDNRRHRTLNVQFLDLVSNAIQSRRATLLKAAKYEIQKPSTCRLTLFRCKFWVDVSRFSPCVINLSRTKNTFCGLKKCLVKSRARLYFDQQILALLLVFHQTCSLSRNKCQTCCPAS